MPDPNPPVYPALWYTSGTPLYVGQRECNMERYLGYHAGVHGTGYRRRQTAVPLVTGGAVHTGLKLIGEWILEWQAKNPQRRLLSLPDDVTAWAATEAAVRYEKRALDKGLLLTKGDATAEASVKQLVLEQRTLVEGLVWMYALVRLPYMLSEFKLFDVEVEETPVLDCTCGLGDWYGGIEPHRARNCQGIVAQARADYTWEAVIDQSLLYEEFKTKASERKSWDDAWEHSGQLWLNMEAKTRRVGRPVNTAFVPTLYKGWRGKDRNAGPEEPKYQHSILCYGYFDPGALPMRDPNWSARYKWTDDWGKGHTLPRTYQRTPVWEEIDPVTQQPRPMPELPGRPHASRVERYIKTIITPAQHVELVKTIGPFPRPQHRVPDATASLLAEERTWKRIVRMLREAQAYEASHPLVVEMVSRSWNCTKYDGTPCSFKPVCDKGIGWESIESMGLYERREPHHLPERAAFEALGWELPVPEDEEYLD